MNELQSVRVRRTTNERVTNDDRQTELTIVDVDVSSSEQADVTISGVDGVQQTRSVSVVVRERTTLELGL